MLDRSRLCLTVLFNLDALGLRCRVVGFRGLELFVESYMMTGLNHPLFSHSFLFSCAQKRERPDIVPMSSDEYVDSDDEYEGKVAGDDEFDSRPVTGRKQTREEQLYGVFYESGGESPFPSSAGNKRRRGHGGDLKASASSGISFVATKQEPRTQGVEEATPAASADRDSPPLPRFGKGNSSQFQQFLGAGGAGLVPQAPPEPARGKLVEKPTWEKHTKGFGMKMLMKLGYTGGGLGKEGKGISRHVEVAGPRGREGLGSVKESTSIAANKAIERELRGEKPLSDDEANEDRARRRGHLRSAAEATAEEGLWRRDQKPGDKVIKRPKYVTAEEVLAKSRGDEEGAASSKQQSGVVVDMRGPQTKLLSGLSDIAGAASAGPPLLGAELLHNLSLHVDLAEHHIRTFHENHKVRAERQAVLKLEAANLADRVAAGEDQLARFRELEALLMRVSENDGPAQGDPRARVDTFQALCAPRFESEFALFGMAQLGPALLRPQLEQEVRAWSPLEDPGFAGRLLGQWKEKLTASSGHGGLASAWGLEAFHAVADEVVTTKARTALLGSWDVFSVEPAVALIEALDGLASTRALSELLTVVVLPKLHRAVDAWDPRMFNGSQAAVSRAQWRMDLWLHPWLPFLSAELESLLPTVRRKLLAALGPCDCTEPEASSAQRELIGPWLPVLGAAAAEGVAVHVCGKLAAQVRRVDVNPADQQLGVLDSALGWASVLPRHHMSCLVRGELLPTWHSVLAGWLLRTDSAANADLVRWYKGWKSYLLKRLRALDAPLRAELGFGLDLMAAARRLPRGDFEALHGQVASRPGSYLALLKAETSAPPSAAPPLRQEARRPLPLSGSGMASFKDVVAAFAETEGVVFALKATKSEGRPLYTFGGLTVLLEHDVVHLEETKGQWRPVSLLELREMAR